MGVAFTRFQSKFFESKYANLNSRLLSYGPCQTPTLGFVVDRYDQIQQFVPERYWSLQTRICALTTASHAVDGQVPVQWARGRVFDKAACTVFFNQIKLHEQMVVVSCLQV